MARKGIPLLSSLSSPSPSSSPETTPATPMRAWLTPPHGRHHKGPPQPCALTTTKHLLFNRRTPPFFLNPRRPFLSHFASLVLAHSRSWPKQATLEYPAAPGDYAARLWRQVALRVGVMKRHQPPQARARAMPIRIAPLSHAWWQTTQRPPPSFDLRNHCLVYGWTRRRFSNNSKPIDLAVEFHGQRTWR